MFFCCSVSNKRLPQEMSATIKADTDDDSTIKISTIVFNFWIAFIHISFHFGFVSSAIHNNIRHSILLGIVRTIFRKTTTGSDLIKLFFINEYDDRMGSRHMKFAWTLLSIFFALGAVPVSLGSYMIFDSTLPHLHSYLATNFWLFMEIDFVFFCCFLLHPRQTS